MTDRGRTRPQFPASLERSLDFLLCSPKPDLSLHSPSVLNPSPPRAARPRGRYSGKITPAAPRPYPGVAGPRGSWGEAFPVAWSHERRRGKGPVPPQVADPHREGARPRFPASPGALPGPYLDGAAAARGRGPPYQLAVELWPGSRAAEPRLAAGGCGPNPRRLRQVKVGRVQAEPGRFRGFPSGRARGGQQQQQRQQRDWPRCPAPSSCGCSHAAARRPPSSAAAAAAEGLRGTTRLVAQPSRDPRAQPQVCAAADACPRPTCQEPAAWGRLLSSRLWSWSRHGWIRNWQRPASGQQTASLCKRAARCTLRAGKAKGVPGLLP